MRLISGDFTKYFTEARKIKTKFYGWKGIRCIVFQQLVPEGSEFQNVDIEQCKKPVKPIRMRLPGPQLKLLKENTQELKSRVLSIISGLIESSLGSIETYTSQALEKSLPLTRG